MTHTPGPWHRGKRGSSQPRETMTVMMNLGLVYAGENFNERVVAYVPREDDAVLIHAAPALLEACHRCALLLNISLEALKDDPKALAEGQEAVNAARAAIAKVTGKES